MMPRLALWLALRIVRVVAMLVPAAVRDEWMREWNAELQHSAHRRRGPNHTWRTHMDLISRALGSLPDAAWIRRQFTLDADAVHDAAHAVRMLLKVPAFTAFVLLVFAIGIGATTAIVSLADTLFLRALPVPEPERVMTVWQYNRDTGAERLDVGPGNSLDWMTRVRSFETIAIAEPWGLNSAIAGREPEYLSAARVSEQFFTVLRTADAPWQGVSAGRVPSRRRSRRDSQLRHVEGSVRQRPVHRWTARAPCCWRGVYRHRCDAVASRAAALRQSIYAARASRLAAEAGL